MSTVTQFYLSSHNVSNVSSRWHSGSLAHLVPDSLMESVGEPRNFLEVVDANCWDWDEDEGESRIKPKSSPLPRRRVSESSDDSEPEPLPVRPRRVSFADAFGLSLVCVKEFDSTDVSPPPGMDALEGNGRDPEEYFLSSLFAVPSSADELTRKLEEQKCEVECVELLPGTTTLRGMIRVLNLCFSKMVYVRTTLDGWCTHFDLLAEFIPGSSDGETDRFLFKLILVPPFEKDGAKVEFCVRKSYSVDDCQLVIPTDAPDIPKQKQEVVVRKTLESTLPHSEGLHEDDRQKSLVDSNCNYSWRSRRRAARLARIQNHFYQKETEAQQGDISAQGKETRHVEMLSEISMPPRWETTSSLPGIHNRNQINSTEQTVTHDQIPPSPLESDRDSTLPFPLHTNDTWNVVTSDMQYINQQEEDAVHSLPEDEIPPAGGRESWDTFVEDTHTTVSTTAQGEAVLGSALFDSAASPADTIITHSHSINGPAIACENAENLLVCEGDASVWGRIETNGTDETERVREESSPSRSTTGTRVTLHNSRGENPFCQHTNYSKIETPVYQQAFRRKGTVSPDIAHGSDGGDCTSDKMSNQCQIGSIAHHSQLTETADIQSWFPCGAFVASVDQLQISSNKIQSSAPSDRPKTEVCASKQKEPISKQGKDTVHSSQSIILQEARGPDAEVIFDADDAAECVRHHEDSFPAKAAELRPGSGEADTQTEPGGMTAMPEPLSDSHKAASNVRELVSNVSFAQTFRGRGGNAKEGEEEVFEENKDEASMENIEDIAENKEEVSKEKREGLHYEMKEDISFGKKILNEDEKAVPMKNEDLFDEEVVFKKNEDLNDEDTFMGNEEDIYDEEIAAENEYDEEEIPTENEYLYDEEVSMENIDLHDVEAISMENKDFDTGFYNVQEEESTVNTDLGKETEEVSVENEEDLDNEVAEILGGMRTAFDAEEELSMKKENAGKINEEVIMRGDNKSHKKEKEENVFSEKEVYPNEEEETFFSKKQGDVGEGADAFRKEKKEPSRRGESLRRESLTTQCPSEDDLKLSTVGVRCVQKQQPTQTTAGDNSKTSRSARKTESMSQYDEAKEKNSFLSMDLGPVEKPECHTTVRPPVEKVENVARNYLFWWRDFFPLGHISRAFLYALLCVVFLVTVFHYDFLPCFALYLFSVYWLYFHGEKQRLQGTDRIE
ncbi:uncharacterized protein LOC118770760 isoform X2 [Megalops cyprinoides]|uniref:uncharacterized protein LOC118770760 isoform X2 n=1 Tax=Megalops cyprinoides TaxID=118141 RepID=UPI001864818C|nr:uncharacterized protein LOC118770760 isoform X2 [Megalops cyprinoides]